MINGIGEAGQLSIGGMETGKTTVLDSLSSFAGLLLEKTNGAQLAADSKIQQYTMGAAPLHEAMISVEKASVAFQFLSQVRNKAVEAYQEIMRMQV